MPLAFALPAVPAALTALGKAAAFVGSAGVAAFGVNEAINAMSEAESKAGEKDKTGRVLMFVLIARKKKKISAKSEKMIKLKNWMRNQRKSQKMQNSIRMLMVTSRMRTRILMTFNLKMLGQLQKGAIQR